MKRYRCMHDLNTCGRGAAYRTIEKPGFQEGLGLGQERFRLRGMHVCYSVSGGHSPVPGFLIVQYVGEMHGTRQSLELFCRHASGCVHLPMATGIRVANDCCVILLLFTE
jgi:hypothetical protein